MLLKKILQSKSAILFLIAFFLFLVPFLMWGNTYLVGGDDTKLYYISPYEFLKNYAFNIVSDNTLGGAMTGYASVSYFAPVFFVIALLKLVPFISTQMLMYGLNLAFGFFSFYKFIGLWVESKNTKGFYSCVIASLFYVSATYLVHTLYTHQLLAMYLVSIVPFTMYFFIKGVREDSLRFVIVSALIFSLFSSTINTLPWSAAFFIVLLPYLVYEAFLSKRRFMYYSSLFIIFSFLLNVHWIFHFVYQYIHPVGLQSMIQYYSSSDFIKDNIRIITAVSQLYSPLNIPFAQMDNNFLINFSWVTAIQGIFFACIVLPAALLTKVKKVYSSPYLVSLAAFLLGWFFFSPDLGTWGRETFLYMSLHIPFFTMFRNMYDKFALPLSFAFAMSLAVSLHIMQQKIKHWVFVTVCIGLFIFIGANAVSSTQYLKRTISESATFSGTFTTDFTDLATYLQKEHDPSHVLWIPLNAPTYANIEDKYLTNHFYSGLSPLRVLADMSDYTGGYSFITQSDLFLGDKLFKSLEDKQYDMVGKIAQQRNAKYIVVDHQNLPSNMSGFMYGGESKKLLTAQGSEFQKVMLGNKIKDFGSTYSLYTINPRFGNDKLYLTNDFKIFPQKFNELSYTKKSSYEYDISINNLQTEKKLVFLDPFSKDWVLYLQSNKNKRSYAQGENVLVYNYANGWVISPERIKREFSNDFYTTNPDGSLNLHMILYFKPQMYNPVMYMVSLGTYVVLSFGALFGFTFKKKIHEK